MLKIFMFFLVLSSIAFASDNPVKERHFFGYGEAATLGGYPMVGGGMRYKNGSHGLDLSLDVMPISPSIFHVRGQYLHYPWEKGLYYGCGLGLFHDPEFRRTLYGACEGSLGYQWVTSSNIKSFIDLNLTIPFNGYPFPGIRFGLGF